MADGHRKWPGETDDEFSARLVQEEQERTRTAGGERSRRPQHVERKRRPGETDEAFAERVLATERERQKKQRHRDRKRLGKRPLSPVPSAVSPVPVPAKRVDMSPHGGTSRVIHIAHRKLAEGGGKVPTLYGISASASLDPAAVQRDIERDTWRDKNGTGPRTFLEGGVGGEGLSPVFPPPSEGKTRGQTENLDGTRDT